MDKATDRTHALLDVALAAVQAIHDYEALLTKPPEQVQERAFKAVHRRMFENAHRVEKMRLKNLVDALEEIGESSDYQDWMRRN